ncbi:MAG: caspase family protein [Thermodesulfobacteriota bacterium]
MLKALAFIFAVYVSLSAHLFADERGLEPANPKPTYQMNTEGQGLSTIDLGQYYALIIGNKRYSYWPSLDTPERDAIKVDEVLREKYGFRTKVLINATRSDILQALNEYQRNLTEKDNLLVYYAGHGFLDEKITRGYWVPVDGKLDSPVDWISTFDISDFLGRMSAKHVIVVADSCYSGALTRTSFTRLEVGMSDEARQYWLKTMSEKRSRTVLSSGDLQPVLDTGGGGHSVFTRAFLNILTENNDVLEGQTLYNQIAAQVAYAASSELEQIPRYGPISHAGHESGDFLFIPKQYPGSSINVSRIEPRVIAAPIKDSRQLNEPPPQTQAPKVTNTEVQKVEPKVLETSTGETQISSITKEGAIKRTKPSTVLRKDGFAYYQNKQYDLAIEKMSKAIELDPQDHYTYYYRGICYLELKDYQKAISDFDKAIELNPNYSDAYGARGLSYTFVKEYQQALNDFNEVLRLDPTNRDAQANKNELLKQMK